MELENLVDTDDDGGVQDDFESRKQELEELQRELDKRARDLNKGFMEIAERERRLSTTAPSHDDDDDIEVPEAAAKVMDKYVSKKVAPIIQAQQELYNEAVNSEIRMAARELGVAEEDILDTIQKRNLQPSDGTIGAAREVIRSAAELSKASKFDEKEIEKRIRENLLKELAEKGVKIEGVKPTRELPQTTPRIEDMTPAERYEYIKAKAAQ